MKKSKSGQSGAPRDGMIENRQATPFSSGGYIPKQVNPSMSDTLVLTRLLTPDFQPTENLETISPNAVQAKIIHAFAAKLGAAVEWRRLELEDGRVGWALFFDERKWLVDPITHEMTPL